MLPEEVYFVIRKSNVPKPYYGRKDKRLYMSKADADTFKAPPGGSREVYRAKVTWERVDP